MTKTKLQDQFVCFSELKYSQAHVTVKKEAGQAFEDDLFHEKHASKNTKQHFKYFFFFFWQRDKRSERAKARNVSHPTFFWYHTTASFTLEAIYMSLLPA